jgi:hypothetical protein
VTGDQPLSPSIADRLGDIRAIADAWREALAHLDDEDAGWPEPYTDWDSDDLADLVAAAAFAAGQATGHPGQATADHDVMDAVLTYMTDHLGAGNQFGLYDGHRLLAAARAFQCRFADTVELADHWLEDAWPGLTAALGSFLDREGIGRQLLVDDPWVYVPDGTGGFFCFASVTQALSAPRGPVGPTSPAPSPRVPSAAAPHTGGRGWEGDQDDEDPGDWYHLTGAQATIASLRAEVTAIVEYAQEASEDLDIRELAELDLDNVHIAVSSVHAASDRALAQLVRLLGAAPDVRQ